MTAKEQLLSLVDDLTEQQADEALALITRATRQRSRALA